MKLLNKLLGRGTPSRPPFDPKVIVARILSHHMTKHLAPGDGVDLPACGFVDPGGDELLVSVACVGANGRSKKLYALSLSTGQITERT